MESLKRCAVSQSGRQQEDLASSQLSALVRLEHAQQIGDLLAEIVPSVVGLKGQRTNARSQLTLARPPPKLLNRACPPARKPDVANGL